MGEPAPTTAEPPPIESNLLTEGDTDQPTEQPENHHSKNGDGTEHHLDNNLNHSGSDIVSLSKSTDLSDTGPLGTTDEVPSIEEDSPHNSLGNGEVNQNGNHDESAVSVEEGTTDRAGVNGDVRLEHDTEHAENDDDGDDVDDDGEDDEGDDDEDMNNLYSAYSKILEKETADETCEPLNTSIVERMDIIEENEEGLNETKKLSTVKKFTASGGSVDSFSESGLSAEFPKTDVSSEGPLVATGSSSLEAEVKPEEATGLAASSRTKEKKKKDVSDSDDSDSDDEEKKKAKTEIKYPDYIEECSTKLKQHYVSAYAKETPLDWFKSDRKPQHRIFTDVYLTSIQLKETVTNRLDDVIIQPSHRVLIIGDSGYGKTCLTHKILHDYGLGLLPSCTRYKILLAIDVTLWSRDQSIDDVIKEQVFKENLEADDRVIDWLKEHSQCVLFVVDGIDRHFDTVKHPIINLTEGQVFPESTVLFLSRPRGSAAIKNRCHVVHHMEKLNDKQITDFIQKLFEHDKENSKSLLVTIVQDDHELYRIPLNLSLLCRLAENSVIKPTEGLPQSQTKLFDKLFLYSLRKVADDTERPLDELAFLITNLALQSIRDQHFSLNEDYINKMKINNEVKEKLVDNGILEKVPCKDIHYFPYRLYQEFLAAKNISLSYFKALNSEQIGVIEESLKNELDTLFSECWSCDNPSYRFDKICVFISGLLGSDIQPFVDVLRRKFRKLKNADDRNRCRELVYACIRENHNNKTLVSLLADSIDEENEIEMTDDDYEYQSDGVATMLQTDKLNKLSLNSQIQQTGLKRLCQGLQSTKRLQELKINFDGFEHENLKTLSKAIVNCSSLRKLSLTFTVDNTSMESTETISTLFLNRSSDLKSLGVNLLVNSRTSYYDDRPTVAENLTMFERLNMFLSRMTIFLQNNPSVEHIELGGLFLHKDCLPEMCETLISHPGLKSIHVSGQNQGAPLHREGVLALSNILGNKRFQEVSIDLNSFRGELQVTREGKKWVRFEGYTSSELIMTRLLKSMQQNQNLRKVRFTCSGLDCDLVDLVSDFVESCDALKDIVFECKELDDLLLLFLSCGLLCSLSVETVHLKGEVISGSALLLLIETCLMSFSVRHVTLDCQPIRSECVEWLCDNLPHVEIAGSHPVTLVMKGRIEEDEDNLLDKLTECATPLDLLLEIDLRDD